MAPHRELTPDERGAACADATAAAVAWRQEHGLTAGALVPVPWSGTDDERWVVQRMLDNRGAHVALEVASHAGS